MTKALHVCRHLYAAGWRVVLLETHKYWHVGARLSNSVAEFHTVPLPEQHPEDYVHAIAGDELPHIQSGQFGETIAIMKSLVELL